MALPVTFTAGNVLTAAQLNSNFNFTYADYIDYTPTITGWTAGNMTFSTKYSVTGDMVNYQGSLTFGTTSAVTATSLTVSLPVAQVDGANVSIFGVGTWRDVSTSVQVAGYCQVFGSGPLNLFWLDPETAPLAVRLEPWTTAATLPFTFATGDQVSWNVTYPKA